MLFDKQVRMVSSLTGVCGLTVFWPVAQESKKEAEPVLAPSPRGMEMLALVKERRPESATREAVQQVKIYL